MPVEFLDYGVLGVLAFFMYLQSRRQSKQDTRQYKLESNHMEHQTEALTKMTMAVDRNTDASKANVDASLAVSKAVERCGYVQNAKDGLH